MRLKQDMKAHQTPRAAAIQLNKKLCRVAKKYGYPEPWLLADNKPPQIIWEDGPYEWAISIGVESLVASELEDYGGDPSGPEFELEPNWYIEADNSFTISIEVWD